MSLFIPSDRMSADEVVTLCIQARAIVRMCERSAWSDLQNGEGHTIAQAAEDLQFALGVAADMLWTVQERLETHATTDDQNQVKGGAE